jgi:hypothetical protein
MRRYVPILIAGTVLIAAACSDSIAPTRSTSELQQFNGSSAPASLVWGDYTSGSYTFSLDPKGGSVKFGAFRLNYGANAVCDPRTSGYGPSYWQMSCTTLTSPITITATVTFANGESSVEFSPDIRFSPNASVYLAAKRSGLVGQMLTDDVQKTYSILYYRMVDGVRQTVDEAATDSEVASKYDNVGGWVWRRVRHFSGYYVRSGYACDETDASCSTGVMDTGTALIQ